MLTTLFITWMAGIIIVCLYFGEPDQDGPLDKQGRRWAALVALFWPVVAVVIACAR